MSDDASPRPASRTLGDLVDEMATAAPGAEALVFRDERLDYAGLKARVNEFARALLAVGIRRRDRIALLVTNRTEWIVAAFALLPAAATPARAYRTPNCRCARILSAACCSPRSPGTSCGDSRGDRPFWWAKAG